MAARRCFAVIAIKPSDVQNADGGYSIVEKKSTISFLYFNKTDALEKARDLAESNPRIPVLLLESTTVIEAKKPELISKDFRENGELLPNSA
jgi:hypothetical protein